jgi:hypothetical protein
MEAMAPVRAKLAPVLPELDALLLQFGGGQLCKLWSFVE